RLSGRRISGAKVLLIEGEETVATLEDVTEPQAQVGAVGSRLPVRGRQVGALESESAISRLQRCGDQTLAPARLHLEKGIGTHPQGHVRGAQVAVGIPFLVAVGGQAKL